MYPSRKRLLSLALVVGLFAAPTLAAVHAPGAPGGVLHPLVVQPATTDGATRRRRRVRGEKVHAFQRRVVRRLRGAVKRIPATDESRHTRRPPHDWDARGPPRSLRL
jgi:hypothetical protein